MVLVVGRHRPAFGWSAVVTVVAAVDSVLSSCYWAAAAAVVSECAVVAAVVAHHSAVAVGSAAEAVGFGSAVAVEAVPVGSDYHPVAGLSPAVVDPVAAVLMLAAVLGAAVVVVGFQPGPVVVAVVPL